MNRDTFAKNVVFADDDFSDRFWTGGVLWLPTNNRMFTNLIVRAKRYAGLDHGTLAILQ